MMGPGVDGTLDGGNVGDLSPVYAFSARYHEDGAINIPGPGAIPFNVIYKPFAFTGLIAGELPPVRTQPYLCISMTAEEDLTIHLPDTMHGVSLPQNQVLSAAGVDLSVAYAKPNAGTIHVLIKAHVDHPQASCSPAYYAQVHATLAQMIAALRAQMLYQ
jgi:hypothetical protein